MASSPRSSSPTRCRRSIPEPSSSCRRHRASAPSTSGGGIPDYGDADLGRTMLHAEVGWFAHRAAWHLIYAGVFERHPGLKFVLTEVSTGWVPSTFAQLDATTGRYRMQGSSANFFGGNTAGKLPMDPSDYFRRNMFIGASFLHRTEADLRH